MIGAAHCLNSIYREFLFVIFRIELVFIVGVIPRNGITMRD